jgi:hypothetical protein
VRCDSGRRTPTGPEHRPIDAPHRPKSRQPTAPRAPQAAAAGSYPQVGSVPSPNPLHGSMEFCRMGRCFSTTSLGLSWPALGDLSNESIR